VGLNCFSLCDSAVQTGIINLVVACWGTVRLPGFFGIAPPGGLRWFVVQRWRYGPSWNTGRKLHHSQGNLGFNDSRADSHPGGELAAVTPWPGRFELVARARVRIQASAYSLEGHVHSYKDDIRRA
jgi:hypothetical protein